ncbi:hypothetical protein [Terricaulis sp.]|uniref:hypothetical protein n=1 Tax=Terricaulis sp. TaxID=2768686 RepID=UPI003783B5E4
MAHTQVDHHSDGGGWLLAFVFGIVLTVFAFGAFSVLGDGRSEPMHTASIENLVPDLPRPDAPITGAATEDVIPPPP